MSTADTSITRSITVKAPVAFAFTFFTEQFNRWWPRTHHIGKAEPFTAILEGRSGGRWFERGVDGSECEWGRVLVYAPPRHVAVSWHLGPKFVYDPDPARASRVDVTFHDEGDGSTRVDLVHSLLDRHGPEWRSVRDVIAGEGGWSGIITGYAASLGA